jgi:hypothetical protein
MRRAGAKEEFIMTTNNNTTATTITDTAVALEVVIKFEELMNLWANETDNILAVLPKKIELFREKLESGECHRYFIRPGSNRVDCDISDGNGPFRETDSYPKTTPEMATRWAESLIPAVTDYFHKIQREEVQVLDGANEIILNIINRLNHI